MNVVMTGDGKFVEVQGTAEGAAFDRAELDALLALAEKGCADLTRLQHEALARGVTGRGLPRLAQPQEARGDAADPRAARARASWSSGSTRWRAYAEPVEDQPDFQGNALLKARAGRAATGLPTLADDSGLCVDALNGMPGVLSARWAGPPRSDARNNALLLAQLEDVPDERRAGALRVRGRLLPPRRHRAGRARPDARADRPRAAGRRRLRLRRACSSPTSTPARELTSAELDPAEKDRISHRGRALREIAPDVAASLTATATADRLLTERDTSQPQSAASGNMISEYTAAGTEMVTASSTSRAM